MTTFITNYLLSIILNEENVKNFYNTLIGTHYYCEDDFKLKSNYGILLFIDTLFLIKDEYEWLKIPHAQLCELYQYIAENRLKIFHYVSFKASANNDLRGLRLLIDEFKKDNWIMLFGYYVYYNALDLLNSKDDIFDIKQKVYAIICILKETQVIKVAQVKEKENTEPLCDACENDCPICLDTMDITNSITTLCKHSFHSKCLYPMFDEAVKQNSTRPKISCPLCRADVFIKSKITFKEIVNY